MAFDDSNWFDEDTLSKFQTIAIEAIKEKFPVLGTVSEEELKPVKDYALNYIFIENFIPLFNVQGKSATAPVLVNELIQTSTTLLDFLENLTDQDREYLHDELKDALVPIQVMVQAKKTEEWELFTSGNRTLAGLQKDDVENIVEDTWAEILMPYGKKLGLFDEENVGADNLPQPDGEKNDAFYNAVWNYIEYVLVNSKINAIQDVVTAKAAEKMFTAQMKEMGVESSVAKEVLKAVTEHVHLKLVDLGLAQDNSIKKD